MLDHHRHASETPNDDGSLIVVFGSSLPSSTKNQKQKTRQIGPTLTKRSGSAHAVLKTEKPVFWHFVPALKLEGVCKGKLFARFIPLNLISNMTCRIRSVCLYIWQTHMYLCMYVSKSLTICSCACVLL